MAIDYHNLNKDPERDRKIKEAAWEKGIFVRVVPLERKRFSDVRLDLDVRGQIIRGKKTYSQRKPEELNEKIKEVYKWAYFEF